MNLLAEAKLEKLSPGLLSRAAGQAGRRERLLLDNFHPSRAYLHGEKKVGDMLDTAIARRNRQKRKFGAEARRRARLDKRGAVGRRNRKKKRSWEASRYGLGGTQGLAYARRRDANVSIGTEDAEWMTRRKGAIREGMRTGDFSGAKNRGNWKPRQFSGSRPLALHRLRTER